jgi:aminopeptidase N
VVSAPRPEVALVSPAAVPIVNAGQTGYFRTAYAPKLWARLVSQFARLAAADQLGLLYDSRALGEAGYVPMSDFLALTRYADPNADPIVLKTLAQQLDALDGYYDGRQGQPTYRAFARARLAPVLARLGWEPKPGEADNDAVLRKTLITVLGDLGDPGVIAEARRRFAAYRANPASLTGSGRQTVLAIVAANADAETWEQIHQLARTSTDVADKTRLYAYLGDRRDPALADKALALALSGEPSPTDAPEIIASVAGSYPDRAYDFALAHRAQVEKLLEPTSRTQFFTRLASGSHEASMVDKLQAFAKTIPASSRGEVDKALGSILYRRAMIAQRLPEVDRWLAANPG